MKLKVLILLIPFFVMGSQIANSQSRKVDLPVIDVLKKYPEKKIRLQDIADIEYIRLETTDDILLSGISTSSVSTLSYVSNKYI